MYGHTELCEINNDGSFCNCQPISVQLAGEGQWAPSNGASIYTKGSEPATPPDVDDNAIRVSIRRYSRCGENL